MPKFSIIVPIYNVVDYLPQCIESVLKQQYKDYELILVDDGSTDNCGGICDLYAKENEKIRVIHKENEGAAVARNRGIEVAKGEYLIFLDGDDILGDDALIQICKAISNNNIDLLICEYVLYNDKTQSQNIILKMKNINELFIKKNEIPWAVWQSVYRRENIINNKIFFENGLISAEDCDFFMRIIEKSNNIYYSDIKIIKYRSAREGSITNDIKIGAIEGQIYVFYKYFTYYLDKNILIAKYFAEKYLNTIFTIYKLNNKDEIVKVIEQIKRDKKILKYANGVKYDFAKFIWQIFGYYKGSKILATFRNKKYMIRRKGNGIE